MKKSLKIIILGALVSGTISKPVVELRDLPADILERIYKYVVGNRNFFPQITPFGAYRSNGGKKLPSALPVKSNYEITTSNENIEVANGEETFTLPYSMAKTQFITPSRIIITHIDENQEKKLTHYNLDDRTEYSIPLISDNPVSKIFCTDNGKQLKIVFDETAGQEDTPSLRYSLQNPPLIGDNNIFNQNDLFNQGISRQFQNNAIARYRLLQILENALNRKKKFPNSTSLTSNTFEELFNNHSELKKYMQNNTLLNALEN